MRQRVATTTTEDDGQQLLPTFPPRSGFFPLLCGPIVAEGYLCSKMTGYALDLGVPATALSLYSTAASGILSGAVVLAFLPFLR